VSEITKETWQKIGLKLLDQEGLGALKISRISAELDVTKGSFYHWFTSKAHFEKSILEYWKQVFTDEFIENADQGTSSKEKLKRLIENCIESLKVESRLEMEINIWAHQAPKMGAFIKEVYATRFDYLIKLLEDIYSDKTEAKRHGLILYSLIIGVELFYQKLDRQELEMVFKDYL
jgi:AcrR family transcriptional regulator